jgi:hypothetical protein
MLLLLLELDKMRRIVNQTTHQNHQSKVFKNKF